MLLIRFLFLFFQWFPISHYSYSHYSIKKSCCSLKWYSKARHLTLFTFVKYGYLIDVSRFSRKTKTNIKTILPDLSSYAYLSICTLANISTSDQCCFNVVDQRWNNVRRWTWNKITRRIFNVAQRSYNVSARRWNNLETTLHNVETTLHKVGITLIQPCLNLMSMLVKTRASDDYGFANRRIVLILLKEKTFFTIY